jgi:hypothetical protein
LYIIFPVTGKNSRTCRISLLVPSSKGGFKSEETGVFFCCQNEYSKSLSWAENLNFPPKTVNNLFKFSAQDSDLEYIFILATKKFFSIYWLKATFSTLLGVAVYTYMQIQMYFEKKTPNSAEKGKCR